MKNVTAEKIEELCESWCSASTLPDGGIGIGGSSERYRLLANGIVFHELDYESLCATIAGLTKVLLRPGLNTFIDRDHHMLWAWCGSLMLGTHSTLFSEEQREIKRLFLACIHAALAHCRELPTTDEEWEKMRENDALLPIHAKQFVDDSHLALAYLGFPLLEAVLKRACAMYVSFDGKVLNKFSVQKRNGKPREYNKGSEISSLRDLLYLHNTSVATSELNALISRICAHLYVLDGSTQPFDLIYKWRNQSLHGSTNFQTIGGTVLNFALMISLFEIKDSFEEYRKQTLQQIDQKQLSHNRHSWFLYPPC